MFLSWLGSWGGRGGVVAAALCVTSAYACEDGSLPRIVLVSPRFSADLGFAGKRTWMHGNWHC